MMVENFYEFEEVLEVFLEPPFEGAKMDALVLNYRDKVIECLQLCMLSSIPLPKSREELYQMLCTYISNNLEKERKN